MTVSIGRVYAWWPTDDRCGGLVRVVRLRDAKTVYVHRVVDMKVGESLSVLPVVKRDLRHRSTAKGRC